MNTLINIVNNLLQVVLNNSLQCCAAPCSRLWEHWTLLTTLNNIVVTTINKLVSLTIVGSCSNNIATTVLCQHRATIGLKNTHQHCQFNKCRWILITILFRRCSANNVASTGSISARVEIFDFILFENNRTPSDCSYSHTHIRTHIWNIFLRYSISLLIILFGISFKVLITQNFSFLNHMNSKYISSGNTLYWCNFVMGQFLPHG